MIHFRFHLNRSHAERLPVIFIHESVMFTSDVLSPVHSVNWSAHSLSRSMPLSRSSTVAAQLRWFPMTGSSQCHRRPQHDSREHRPVFTPFCAQTRARVATGPGTHAGCESHPACVPRPGKPNFVCQIPRWLTVNNMKNPRCATGLSIRYVGLPFVILISFMYDMYFAVIVIWLCICLDPWSIKKLLLLNHPGVSRNNKSRFSLNCSPSWDNPVCMCEYRRKSSQ